MFEAIEGGIVRQKYSSRLIHLITNLKYEYYIIYGIKPKEMEY